MQAEIVSKMLDEMSKSVAALQKELVKVRTGRASTTLVDGVQVEYYGSTVPLGQVSNVTTPDARTVQIAPWEQNMVAPIEKAILAANLGLTPQNNGKLIRIPVPPLTEERRKEMVKQIKKIGEDAKVGIRNHRREANVSIKSAEKQKGVSQDEAKKAMEDIQKKTDDRVKEVDSLIESKEKEIMTV